jgi:hypothetical protein
MNNFTIFPLLFQVILIVAGSLFITSIGFIIVRKKFPHEELSESHTVASYIFNAFSISYGVLLAFIVYANWYDNERAQQNVYYETSYISNLYRDTQILPDSIKKIVNEKIINYTKAVIDDEWVKLSEEKTSPLAESTLDDLWKIYTNIPVSQISNPYLYQVSLEKLNNISQYRRLRILDMKQTTPTIIWIVLFICFSVSLGYAYFFTTKKRGTHLILITTFIIINILIFYLIYVLDHPYQGYSSISSEPFKLLLDKFSNYK